jgi:replicative DNA helicase
MQAVDTLEKFGQSYQSKVIAALLSDLPFLNQVSEITSKDYFESEQDKWIIESILDYQSKQFAAPTLDVFKVKLSSLSSDSQKKQIVDRIKQIYDVFGAEDMDFVKQEFIKFSKFQKLKAAIFQSVDLIKSEKSWDEIGVVVQNALKAGMENNLGHDYYKDIAARMEVTKRSSVPTGWKPINELMDGGLGPGELGVIVAPSGVGKTWVLCKIAADAVRAGYNVMHYTLELSEIYAGTRYDTIMTGIPSNELRDRKDEVVAKLKNHKANLMVKYYPPRGASTKTIKAHLDKYKGFGFKPDLIIIDYADLLKPVNKRDSTYAELGGVYEEIRGLSGELGVPIWTASQTNRSAIDFEVIQADSIADSYAKVMTADFIMSVSRKAKDKLSNTARFHVMKNRFGADGLTFPAKMDTMVGLIDVFEPQSSDGVMAQKESNNGSNLEKKLLHKKYIENMG